MAEICKLHYPDLRQVLLDQCLQHFYALRAITKLRKMPSTSELLDWIGVLLKSGMWRPISGTVWRTTGSGISMEELKKGIPFLGTLIKKEKDYEIAVDKLKFPT